MSNEYLCKEDLTKERTPSELWDWLIQKVKQICATKEGLEDFRLQKGLLKQLVEEVTPLAMFGKHKFGVITQILLQPVIGNQNYDAIITDLTSKFAHQSYLEITQSHEGEKEYLRRLFLQRVGFTFGHGHIIKEGTKKAGLKLSLIPQAVNTANVAREELKRILDAAKRKEGKDYPVSTSLIIIFDDDRFFRLNISDSVLVS